MSGTQPVTINKNILVQLENVNFHTRRWIPTVSQELLEDLQFAAVVLTGQRRLTLGEAQGQQERNEQAMRNNVHLDQAGVRENHARQVHGPSHQGSAHKEIMWDVPNPGLAGKKSRNQDSNPSDVNENIALRRDKIDETGRTCSGGGGQARRAGWQGGANTAGTTKQTRCNSGWSSARRAMTLGTRSRAKWVHSSHGNTSSTAV